MAIFGPIWTQFRSKQLKIWPESHWIDRIDHRIDRIDANFDVTVSMLTFSMLNSMLTSFVFDVTRLEIFDAKMVSILQFSIFPYSILTPSILKKRKSLKYMKY